MRSFVIKALLRWKSATIGFKDGKDPDRVPDQKDTYAGEQVTIFDNRGLCQHSGFCSYRLPAVFRVKQEPFVAPSGGRMDEIIRAVRDCPSGALGYAIDGFDQRDSTDWHDTREPGLEVSKDGPYLWSAAYPYWKPTERRLLETQAPPSSIVRYADAVIRRTSRFARECTGTSSSKTRFRHSDGTPTVFEWAGGLPALTRMTRIFYEKYVPNDDLLSAACLLTWLPTIPNASQNG